MATKVITSFSSSDPLDEEAAQKTEAKYDFHQVFEALRHDLEVAENVFSRCAKKLFRNTLTESVHVKLLLPDEDITLYPVWVVSSSITLRTGGEWDQKMWASFLESLVVEQAQQVLRIRDDNEGIRLIGPLSTAVKVVGEDTYSFSIKQRWSLDG